MKTHLDAEELAILEAYEKGLLISSKNEKQEIGLARKMARNTLHKSKPISIRLSEKDLERIKLKALEAGMPYQTLISALVHQYAENKIKIKI